MRPTKPQATAAATALLAWLLVLGGGWSHAQDEPESPPAAEEEGPPPAPAGLPEMDYPDDEETTEEETTEEDGDAEKEAEPETEESTSPEDEEGADAQEGGPEVYAPGSAFGEATYPPGTFPEWEPPSPPPEPETPAEGEEGEEGGDEDAPEVPEELDEVEGADSSDIELDAIIPTATKKKFRFQVQGLYELHLNVISADYSANDWLAFWMLRGNFDITKFDQLSLRMDLEQRFVADPGESGLWFGDIRLYYSRKFTLPIPKFPIPGKVSVYFTFPTSRQSIKRSYITKPTLVFALAPSLGPVTLVANGYFRYSIAKYAESPRGGANNMLLTGYMFQLIYHPLDWFAPSAAWVHTFGLPYDTIEGDGQHWQSSYYWEVALNFSIPMPEKAPSIDLSLAFAQGGNPLNEGVYRLYFAKRDQSEVYLGINMIY